MSQSIPKLTAMLAAFLAVSIAAPGTVQAQRVKPVPQAFAAVQAPESAVEVCHSTSARAALDCASSKCQRKAGSGACFAVTACAPNGWAGVMGVQLSEVHFSTVVCGAPTREALMTALRAFCEGHAGLKQCHVGQTWAPDGGLLVVDVTWTTADFRK